MICPVCSLELKYIEYNNSSDFSIIYYKCASLDHPIVRFYINLYSRESCDYHFPIIYKNSEYIVATKNNETGIYWNVFVKYFNLIRFSEEEIINDSYITKTKRFINLINL